MQILIDLFTITPLESVGFIVVFGVFMIASGFITEVFCVGRRISYLLDPKQRHLFTWKTAVWMPVRILVLILLPQVIFQFFTEVVKFG